MPQKSPKNQDFKNGFLKDKLIIGRKIDDILGQCYT